MYERKTKDCSPRSWTFQHRSWYLCLLLWCLPGFITISLWKLWWNDNFFWQVEYWHALIWIETKRNYDRSCWSINIKEMGLFQLCFCHFPCLPPDTATVGPGSFELGYFEFPVLLSAISISRYFEQFFVSPRGRNSGVQLYNLSKGTWHLINTCRAEGSGCYSNPIRMAVKTWADDKKNF